MAEKKLMDLHWCDQCKIRCDSVSNIRWTCKRCDYD